MSQRTKEPAKGRDEPSDIKRPSTGGAAPVTIDHPLAGEAMRMLIEWVNHTVAAEQALDDATGGGQASYVEMISKRIVEDRDRPKRPPKVLKTCVEKNPDGSYRREIDLIKPLTAEGKQSESGPKPTEGSAAPITASQSNSVAETERIMAHLRAMDFPSYMAAVGWVRRMPAKRIAGEASCSTRDVAGNLKAAVLLLTSHVTLGTFA